MADRAAPLLFVTQHYRPELIGSAPFCVDIAEWLAERGRSVTVLTGPPHYPDPSDFPDELEPIEIAGGVTIRRVPSLKPRRNSVRSRIFSELSFLACGLGALLSRRVARHEIVLSLAPSILAIALGIAARKRGGRHVAIVYDIQSGLARGLGMVGDGVLFRLMRWCERWVLNRADMIVVLTESMRRELRDLGVTSPIDVVPIWVNIAAFAPRAAETGDRPLTICYSGNLGLKQGIAQIIELAGELGRLRPDIRLVLRGSGSQADRLAAEVSEHRLGNVRLEPLLPRSQFARGLAEADIHLVPLEPSAAPFMLPSKVFNIMATGLPFVATAEPGSSLWRLHERTGAFLCVRPNAPAEFASAVMTLARDEELRREMGARGRAYVEENCSKELVLGTLLTLIDTVHA